MQIVNENITDYVSEHMGSSDFPVEVDYDGNGIVNITDISKFLKSYPIITSYHYDAFGNHLDEEKSNDTNYFRYCGEYWDKETREIYLRARYYNPKTGRFGTVDPAMDGTNWYVYCNGNPVNFVDPWGLEYGSINAFANDLTQIYGGSPTTWYCSDGSFTVTVGSGAFGKTGTFYQNGYARLLKDHTGRGGDYIAKVGENKNGTMYMKRTDFYKAMGVNYSVASQEIEIRNNPVEGIISTILVGALVSPVGAGVEAIAASIGAAETVATGLGVIATGTLDYLVNNILSKDSLTEGNYRIEYTVGEIYNMASECYESVLTTSYYQLGTDGDGNKTEQLKTSITKYNGRFAESILQ